MVRPRCTSQRVLNHLCGEHASFASSHITSKMKYAVLNGISYDLSKAQEKLNEAEIYLDQSLDIINHLILLSEAQNNTAQKEEWLKEKVKTYTHIIKDSKTYERWEKAEQYLKKKIRLLSQRSQVEYIDTSGR